MSVEIRREMLVRYLREQGRTSVNDLATHFNITGATIRSDLRQLEQSHQVTRRYGGAEAVTQPITEDRTIDEKTALNQNIKQRIGAKAASLVHDGESIILDNGSTTLQMVPWLVERVALTVMTISLLRWKSIGESAQLRIERTARCSASKSFSHSLNSLIGLGLQSQ